MKYDSFLPGGTEFQNWGTYIGQGQCPPQSTPTTTTHPHGTTTFIWLAAKCKRFNITPHRTDFEGH
jgi:hypothetical protein